MKTLFLVWALSLSVWASEADTLLLRIEHEAGKDLGTKLSILASISEERNPKNIHKLCVIENEAGELTYVLNYDTSIKELSLVDELASHHLSNKQFWTIKKFSLGSVRMVTFFGVDAIKGRLTSSVAESGTGLTMDYLYTMGNYKKKSFNLAKVDGNWKLFKDKDTQSKAISRIFFKANKNFFGMVTGIADIILK
jgi:hypothetical protein